MKVPQMMTLLALTSWALQAEGRATGRFEDDEDFDTLLHKWCRTQVEEKTDYEGEFKDAVELFCRSIVYELPEKPCADLVEENRTSYTETSPYLMAFNVIYDEICPENVAEQAPPCGRGRALKKAIRRMQMKGAGRITGGYPVDDCSVVPWQVRLQIWLERRIISCGGSIISNLHILTAAHCVDEVRRLRDVTVILGEFNRDREDPHEEWVGLRSLIIHPDYDSETYVADIAILTLLRPIVFDNPCRAIVCRNPNFRFDGESCFVSGWGSEEVEGEGSSILQAVELKTHEGPNCDREFGIDDPDYISDKEKMICAGHTEDGKDSCDGDSGGALVCLDVNTDKFVQVGIVSYGEEECGMRNRPGVYTNVAYYNNWINQNMN